MAGQQVRIELPQPFAPGAVKLAFVEGRQILIVNAQGRLRAIENSCPHAGGSLFGGKLVGAKLRCPSHGLLVDLATGCIGAGGGPITRVYAIEPVDGGILLALD